MEKKTQASKQTKTSHNEQTDSMQRENTLDNILTGSNLFPEYANIKTEKTSEIPTLPCCTKLQTPASYTFLL